MIEEKDIALLEEGLKAMEVVLSPKQIQQLLAFLEMLIQWNARFNLTAVRLPKDMVSRHLLDSLSIVSYLCGSTVLDVGTGAGLPGIPLSIADPSLEYYLLDSNQKKQIFVSQVIRSLSLTQVKTIHATVETYQPAQKFSTIVTRAFAPLSQMIALTQHLLAPEGRFLAMMGKVTPERLEVPEGFIIERVISLNVPGENAERHLAIVRSLNKSEEKGKIHG